jgi:hypothetical protein
MQKHTADRVEQLGSDGGPELIWADGAVMVLVSSLEQLV